MLYKEQQKTVGRQLLPMPTVEEILSPVLSYPEEGGIPPEMGTLRQHTMRIAGCRTHVIPALTSRP
jgi:hypothetical protein